MASRIIASVSTSEVDPILENLIEEFADLLRAGKAVDAESFIAKHPERAEQLRRFLPAAQVLADLGGCLPSSSDEPGANHSAEFSQGMLGDFLIVRELGRGGMGVVYEAEQVSLGRRVALKVLPFAATMDPRQLQRFHNEARAAAGLHHTNIVPVYGVGQERGIHYYAMQIIDGQTLAALIGQQRQGGLGQVPTMNEGHPAAASASTVAPAAKATSGAPLDRAFFRRAAEWCIQAAEALDYAHSLGVVHRDVKPANLLIDAIGRLWVTDFGLAHVQSDARLTFTGDLVGTLRYMSPEQALAKRVVIDHRTDVYSLGATLYELLTLQPVFQGSDRQELLRQIAFEEAKLPRRVDKSIPAELEIIVLKALEKNPQERYLTAREMADDLDRYLKSEPIHARRSSLAQRVQKWTRRHQGVTRAVAAGFLAVALVSMLSAVMVWGQNQEITEKKQQTDNALQERTAALQARTVALGEKSQALGEKTQALGEKIQALNERTRALYISNVRLAELETRTGSPSRAEIYLDRCAPELRCWEWHYLKRLCHPHYFTLQGHASNVIDLSFTPTGLLVSRDRDGMVKVWDPKTGRETQSFKVAGNPETPRFNCDLTRMAVERRKPKGKGIISKTIAISDPTTGRIVVSIEVPMANGSAACFSPDGKLFAIAALGSLPQVGASAGEPWTVKVWDVQTGAERTSICGEPSNGDMQVAFSVDGKRIAVSYLEPRSPKAWPRGGLPRPQDRGRILKGVITMINLETNRILFTITAHESDVTHLTFSPDGKLLASGGEDWSAKVWVAATGKIARGFAGPTAPIKGLAFSSDGSRLFSADRENEPKPQGQHPLVGTTFIRDAQRSVISTRRQTDPKTEIFTIREWDLHTGKSSRTTKVLGETNIKLNLVSGLGAMAHGKEVNIRYATQYEDMLIIPGFKASCDAAFSPDGSRLAVSGTTLRICDATRGDEIMSIKHSGEALVSGVAYSPDGTHLASCSADGTAKVWNAQTGKQLLALRGHRNGAIAVTFSPDGQRLATCSKDKTVKIWDLSTGQNTVTLPHDSFVCGVAFSPDGQRLVAATGGDPNSDSDQIKIWDLKSGRATLTLKNPPSGVRSVEFSRDGKRIVTTIWDELGNYAVARILDAATGQVLLSVGRSGMGIKAARLTPDGRRLLTNGALGTVLVWDTTTGEEVMALHGDKLDVRFLAFSPDGRRLASFGILLNTVRVWDGTPLD